MQNQLPSDPSQADSSVVALMHGIKTNEGTNGNYNGSGDEGTAAGTGQWSNQVNGVPQPLQKGQIPANFAGQAKQYGLNPDDFSPENQNKVMYSAIAADKKAGLTPEQILSKWNSGDPNKYLNSATSTGTGPVGAYDVASYVKNGMSAAQQYAQETNGATQQTTPDSTSNQDTSSALPDNQQGKPGLLHRLASFALPVIDDLGIPGLGDGGNKTALQRLGDLGLSALWFVPGLGEAAEGLRGAGALAEGAKAVEGGEAVAKSAGLLGKVAKGAANGYGADVLSNLSQGKTGGDVFKPGLGAVTGGALEGVLGKLGSKYSEEGVMKEFAKSNNEVLGQTKRGANDLADSLAHGKDTGDFLTKKGINLKSLVDPETVAYDTTEASKGLRTDATTVNSALTDALDKVPGAVKVSDIESEMLAKVPKNYPERSDLIKKEMGLLKQQYGDSVPASALNEWKQRAWDFSKFDMAVPNETRRTYRMIGNTLKTNVENLAEKGGLDGVDEMNEYIGSHLDSADALDKLHGTKAKGGRLGDLMQKHTLGALGGMAGFGSGPVGALAGALTGEYAGGKLASIMRTVAGSPIRTAILNKMEQEDPEIVQKFIQYANQESPVVQKLRQEMAGEGFTMGATEAKAGELPNKIAPELKPKASKPGKIKGLLSKTAIRASVPTGQE